MYSTFFPPFGAKMYNLYSLLLENQHTIVSVQNMDVIDQVQ